METGLAIRSILEIVGVLLITYMILHEDKFIIFEENVTRIIKRKIRMHRRRKVMEKKRAQQKQMRQSAPQPQRRPEAARYNTAARRQSVA